MKEFPVHLEEILSDRQNDNDLVEVPVADKVFRVFLFLIAVLFIGAVAQLAYLNIWGNTSFTRRARANISDIKIQPAPRGIIVDRYKKPLLHNEPINNIFLLPHDFPENSEERIDLLKKISVILGMEWSNLKEVIEKKDWGRSDRVLVVREASHEQLVSLESVDLRGVYIEPSFKRVPENQIESSHLLGYTGLVNESDMENNENFFVDDEIGRSGLEAYYDEYLRGENGEEVFYRDARGIITEKRSVQEPKSGMMLETAIDRDLQHFMYQRLKEALDSLGRDVGVAIAMNPQNGEILGLVNIPSFDIGNVAEYLSAPFNPLFNRAIGGLYNPGSTIKPLVGTAALTEGVITPETKIFSKGYIEIPNPYNPAQPGRFLDWRPNGWVDIRDALAKSSNIFFYETTGGFENQKGIGIDALKRWWQTFLLDQKTGIDIVGEQKGFLPDPEWKEKTTGDPWRVGDTYNVSIGQGDLLVTPINLLNYVSAIANGGILYTPRIVRYVLDDEGNVVRENTKSVLSDFKEKIKDAIPYIQNGMRDVVQKEYGTAHSLSLLPIAVAAKTGTAQIQNNAKVNAFFVGYAPFDDPSIALIILVENAKEGSLNTIPVANDIFLWYYENRLKK